jgi:hypothetical protein
MLEEKVDTLRPNVSRINTRLGTFLGSCARIAGRTIKNKTRWVIRNRMIGIWTQYRMIYEA